MGCKEKIIEIIGFDPTNKEECLEAVKRDGYALQYIKNQTQEICLEAVKQNGYALKYVKRQTSKICLEAVIQKYDKSYIIELDGTQTEVHSNIIIKNRYILAYVDPKFYYLFDDKEEEE